MDHEESKRLLRLGNLVLVDYVRSMVELLIQHLAETTEKLVRSELQNMQLRMEEEN